MYILFNNSNLMREKLLKYNKKLHRLNKNLNLKLFLTVVVNELAKLDFFAHEECRSQWKT